MWYIEKSHTLTIILMILTLLAIWLACLDECMCHMIFLATQAPMQINSINLSFCLLVMKDFTSMD